MIKFNEFFIQESNLYEDKLNNKEIIISSKLENRFRELKLKNEKLKVGDLIYAKKNSNTKLSNDANNYLESKNTFEVLKINDNGKIDIGFRYYKIVLPSPEIQKEGKQVKVIFYYNPSRFHNLNELDPIARVFLSLKHIDKNNIVDNPINFLDVDDRGNLTYLPNRYYDANQDPFTAPRRQMLKLNRLLLKIITKDYYDRTIFPKDIEIFLNKWRLMFDDSYNIRILEGDDILTAYTTENLSKGWTASSCANFSKKPPIGEFNVYTENSENIKCLVVYHKGKIHGRRMLFTGIQTETHGKFKKGQVYTLLNYMYGEGGRKSKVDQLMIRWAKDNDAELIDNRSSVNIFRIKIKNTCYAIYPPWDSMFVNFDTNEISDSSKAGGKGRWNNSYHARCPKKK